MSTMDATRAGTGTVVVGEIGTPLGVFGAVMGPAGLGRLAYPTEPLSACETWARRWEPGATVVRDPAALEDLAEELTAYLEGALRGFTVPLDLRGTPFQLRVWSALQEIPYGEARSYSDIAAAIGSPGAVRAVGLANGSNPVPIVVPCHRVIGRGGALTGYGGGLEIKERLLRLEGYSPKPARSAGQGRLL